MCFLSKFCLQTTHYRCAKFGGILRSELFRPRWLATELHNIIKIKTLIILEYKLMSENWQDRQKAKLMIDFNLKVLWHLIKLLLTNEAQYLQFLCLYCPSTTKCITMPLPLPLHCSYDSTVRVVDRILEGKIERM